MLRVFVPETSKNDWAIAEEMRLVCACIAPIVTFTPTLEEADVVHAGWWMPLLTLPRAALNGKRVLVNVPSEPRRYWQIPEHRHALPLGSCWVVRNQQGVDQFKAMGVPHTALVPCIIDESIFKPLAPEITVLDKIRQQYNIPSDAYLIGNFHRDSEGADLYTPKLVKGPDLFLETMKLLHNRKLPIHVVLAGPRRHWLRHKLADAGIPYTYVGTETDEDDVSINLLSRETLNVLYNLINLYMVSSRSEGGPQSTMETAAARCKQISTPVGLSIDILRQDCLFRTPVQAADLIARDIETDWLRDTLDTHQERVMSSYTIQGVTPVLQTLYQNLDSYAPISIKPPTPPTPLSKVVRQVKHLVRRDGAITLGLWNEFVPPPYGGANQFLLALRKVLMQQGVQVASNRFGWDIDVHLVNAIRFDIPRFIARSRGRKLPMVHRVDGPFLLIRGTDKDKDEQVFDINQRYASATIVQSAWNLEKIVEMGYHPVKPTIIHNAADPEIFHTHGRIPYGPNRKLRIIASSWSDNPRKGGPVYRWLEENLDWNRFEMTFVGRISEPLKRARMIEALPSQQLADVLRQHDIYITASQNDPCSNSLIEAMTCGMPALYLKDGGHPELVQNGGLPFTHQEEILTQLDELAANYEMYQRLLTPPRMEDVVRKYMSILQDAAKEG